MKNRALSVHQEHELLLKLEQAGLDETAAQAIIESRGNTLAKKVIVLVKSDALVEGAWFSFITTAASLKELQDQNSELYLYDGWLDKPFAMERGQPGRSLQLRTSARPGSFSKTFADQQELLSEGEFVPTVRDLVEGMIVYYRLTGKRLFSDYWVRTQDISTSGFRFIVGFFAIGVSVGSYWDGDRDSRIGLTVARKAV